MKTINFVSGCALLIFLCSPSMTFAAGEITLNPGDKIEVSSLANFKGTTRCQHKFNSKLVRFAPVNQNSQSDNWVLPEDKDYDVKVQWPKKVTWRGKFSALDIAGRPLVTSEAKIYFREDKDTDKRLHETGSELGVTADTVVNLTLVTPYVVGFGQYTAQGLLTLPNKRGLKLHCKLSNDRGHLFVAADKNGTSVTAYCTAYGFPERAMKTAFEVRLPIYFDAGPKVKHVTAPPPPKGKPIDY